ncbi:MAG TPA: HlyD family efflux transporter periplasmic adaptor subunit [Nitrospiraceae bacterium]
MDSRVGAERGTLGQGAEAAPGGMSARAGDQEQVLWADFAGASSVEAFCRSWLALQCRMISGVTGGIVLVEASDRGQFSPAAFWPDRRRNLTHLTAIAEQCLKERRGLAQTRDIEPSGGGVPGIRHEIAYPVEVKGRLHGVVVLDLSQRPDRDLQEATRRLHWGAAWLELLFQREATARDGVTKERMQGILDVTATVLAQDRYHAAAMALASDLATRLGCERVSVGRVRRRRCRVQAVSHSAQFGKQTNLIRAIEAAMNEALDQHASIVYPAPDGAAARVTRAHADLVREQEIGAACSVPFYEGDHLAGVLTLERVENRPFDAAAIEWCEAFSAVAGPILGLRRREDRWVGAKIWDASAAQTRRLFGPRHVGLKLAVLGAAALTMFFALAKGDYRVSVKTVLEGLVVRAAAAPFNGYIAEAPVRAGDVVRQGQLLGTFDDRDLQLERMKWLSQLQQFQKQYSDALAKREAAQVEILTAQLNQAKAELALVEDQLSRTRMVAPFDGVVISGDLSQSLGAPVERGQVLFEVAPLEAYRVVLEVDERDVDDVVVGQRGQLVFSAFPADLLPFTIVSVTPVSTAREGRNYFRVEARLDQPPDQRMRPGMEGAGKIVVDRRLLIWIWTHEAIDWVRLTLWTWLP